MSVPSSVKLTLAQCTGVTPAPVGRPADECKQAEVPKNPNYAPIAADHRQPLHESNSQTSPGSSQRRSHTTSESVVITPSEKRQTMLALSPERTLPAGQQWTTLEVQRVLSLTPGTRHAFRHSQRQHDSLETMQAGTTKGSPTSCSPGSTVAADDSPARHRADTDSPSMKGKAVPHEQQAEPGCLPTDTLPATELHLLEFPETQLVCDATALDLLLCASTQVVGDADPAADGARAESAMNTGHIVQNTVSAQHELALSLGNAQGLTATPVMMMLPIQGANQAQDAAGAHGRAPAGPVTSPKHKSRPVTSALPCVLAVAPDSNAAIVNSRKAADAATGQQQVATEAEAAASGPGAQPQQQAQASSGAALPTLVDSQQQHQTLQARMHGSPPQADAVLLPQHGAVQSLSQSLHPSSNGTGLEVEDSASQESLEGTQAEADALMEESAFGFMNNQQDEGHEERAWGCVVLNTSTTTFQAVASALGWPYDAWTKSKDFVKVDRLLWAARVTHDLVKFSFEGNAITVPLPQDVDWAEGDICTPSEVAQRKAAFEADGQIIAVAHYLPFSCSAAGSSVPAFEATQGTQFGTVMEEAAAIIAYSQMHAAQPPAVHQTLAPEPHPLGHASQTGATASPRQGALAQAPGHPSHTATEAEVQVAAEAVGLPSQLHAVAPQALPGVLHSQAAESHPEIVQAQSDGRASQSRPVELCSASAAVQLQAAQSQTQAETLQTKAVPPNASAMDSGNAPSSRQATAQPTEAAASQSRAVPPTTDHSASHAEAKAAAALAATAAATQADLMTESMADELCDIAPTELQVPQAPGLDLPLSPHTDTGTLPEGPASAAVPDTVDLPRPEDGDNSASLPSVEQQTAASGLGSKEPEACIGEAAEAQAAVQAPQQILPGSPTQCLHLQLTCLESQAAEHHALPAAASPSGQLQLQLTSHPLSPAAQQVPARDGTERCALGGSPANLSLNLDTQLPDQAVLADKVTEGVGGQRSPQPAGRRGWWNQPWSVAQHSQEPGPPSAGGIWGAFADVDVAGEGTEVTPSGLCPPRGTSSTPLLHPPSTGASPQQATLGPAGRDHAKQPQALSPQQDVIIADSEEPLVLYRQHGPAKRAFLDAHALPCSSPNSPPDPLCSYVPATADMVSPLRGIQKRPASAGPGAQAKTGEQGDVAVTVQEAADDPEPNEHSKQEKQSTRVSKKRSKRKAKPAPQMGPPGARHRAGLPAPRYQAHPPRTTPPSATNRLQTLSFEPIDAGASHTLLYMTTPDTADLHCRQQLQKHTLMGQEAAAHQPMSPNLLGTALRNAAAMHACTMEQLPMGPTAFNSCTLEQLPTGTALPSPAAAASPVLGRSGSPVVIAHSMLAEQKPGQGQGLHAAGLCARNAAAALCSARQQGVEPCNAYSFPDSSPDPAEADQPMAPPQQPLPAAFNSAGHAPMPKHGDHRTSLVLRHQLPHARDRLQKLQEVGGKLPIGPPQQSRRKWQLKASAQVNASKGQPGTAQGPSNQEHAAAQRYSKCKGPAEQQMPEAQVKVGKSCNAAAKAGKKRSRDRGSIALDRPARKRQPPPRYDDMVGHSQLDSDMLEASPAMPAAEDCDEYNQVDEAEGGRDSDDEAKGPSVESPSPDTALPLPQPGNKRKRSSLRHSRVQDVLLDKAPGPKPATVAVPVVAEEVAAKPRPVDAPSVKIPSLGCSKCRKSAKGCKKCRSDQQAALQAAALQGLETAGTSNASEDLADPNSRRAPPLAAHPAHAQLQPRPVPVEEADGRPGRRKTRRSADHDDIAQGQGKSTHCPAIADAHGESPVAATQGSHDARGTVAVARPAARRQARPRHKSASAADLANAGGPSAAQQGRAGPSSPALASAGTALGGAGQGRASQRVMQGRAAPSSPVLVSAGAGQLDTGQGRAGQRHRRNSLGGGGVLPFAGHAFLMTAYTDEKQKERVCQKITQLGGHVLDDLPKPQGSRRSSLGGGAAHPVLALISNKPLRTPKLMYARIKGIPIVKENWLVDCVAAHRLMPFEAPHLEEGQGSDGHQAFQGLRLHLAGAPDWLSRLIQHAGGEVVKGAGDIASPGGYHHALQGPCDCIVSEFKIDTDEHHQVHRLARRLRIPVKDRDWAVQGFETGTLPALPNPSPTKPPVEPHASPALHSPLISHQATAPRVQTRQTGATRNRGNTARRHTTALLQPSNEAASVGAAADVAESRGGKGMKRRRVELVIPESEQQAEDKQQPRGSAWAACPAGPEAEEEDEECPAPDAAHRIRSRPRHSNEEQEAQDQHVPAAGRNVVIADSMEAGCSAVADADDVMDEVSSADTEDLHRPEPQHRQQLQSQHHQQQQQQQQQQPQAASAGEQGRAVAGPGQAAVAGVGQLLSGDVQWVGPGVDPPTGLGLTPSQHQTYYGAFTRAGVEVRVGDFVELSPLPGEDFTRLAQVKALWSEPTQARHRMLACCHRFYRGQETRLEYGFPPNVVFSTLQTEDRASLLSVMCKCSIVYGTRGPTGNHNYLCSFTYDYESNSLTSIRPA